MTVVLRQGLWAWMALADVPQDNGAAASMDVSSLSTPRELAPGAPALQTPYLLGVTVHVGS